MRSSLRRLRFPVGRSRGRRYPELPHPYRTDFQRDRDRIVHTRAFRRLEDKTQVFTASLSDHFRNRLTHTLEVTQIARTAASALEVDESLTEALALAHDIGHPPFAHAGEEELNRQMQKHGARFDHNLHALRIVETFEQRYARFPGLNLTFEVREGIVKHSRDLEPEESAGFQEYLPGLRPPLEAQLIDLADEIAYNTADLDDAFSAAFFTVDDIKAGVPQYEALWDEIDYQFPGAPERVRFLESLRKLIDVLVSGLIEGTLDTAEEAGLRDCEDVRNHPRRIARFTAQAQGMNAALKAFLRSRVYYSEPLARERTHSAKLLGDLFEYFVANADRLPSPYSEQACEEPVHRIVCDYIAGMTDGFFLRTYDEVFLTQESQKSSRPYGETS